MSARIKYPVGIQTFSKIREGNYLYVDKTGLMYELVNNNEYVFLSRPRRFGKSLLMSTIESYFRGEKELFRGLEIENLEKDWVKYPVLRFDLSSTNYDKVEKLIERIQGCLDSIEREYGVSCRHTNISERFMKIIERVCQQAGKRVVILIDEYDKPILDCLEEDAHDSIKRELRAFYSVIKASDRYVRFALLTGVTRFSRLSIFSGLNNLKDISMLPKYNSLCGISSSEFQEYFGDSIKEFAVANDLSEDETWAAFKEYYDGYHFASRGENIYNPYSVLNAFDDEKFNMYWFVTGSSSFLVNLVKTHSYRLGNLEGERRNERELTDITDVSRDLVPLLYQAGYLTIKNYDASSREYILGFPNREVKEGFWESLANYFLQSTTSETNFKLQEFVKDLKSGDPEEFMQRLRSLFADIPSGQEKKMEIHFQNMVAIVMKLLGLRVHTEVSSAVGRCDMQILTPQFIYILEFKVDGTPEEALAQIREKGYARPFEIDKRTIYLIGANFSTQSRTLSAWQIEKI